MSRDNLPHYPNQVDRDNAAAAAVLILIVVLLVVGFVAGFVVKAVLG